MSQLFSVARLARFFKPTLKPGWLYVSRISYLGVIIILSGSEGIFYVYTYIYIYVIGYRNAQFTRRPIAFQRMWLPANTPLECPNYRSEHMHTYPRTHTHTHTYIYIYIYIYWEKEIKKKAIDMLTGYQDIISEKLNIVCKYYWAVNR